MPNGAFSTTYINHFESDVTSTSGWLPWYWKNYRKIIGDNLNRRHTIETDHAPQNSYIYFYYYDWHNKCYPDSAGYIHTIKRWWWIDHYITWCPQFFSLPTLRDKIKKVRNLPNSNKEKNILEPFFFTTGALMVSNLQKY